MEYNGQSAQDLFVLKCLKYKRNGTYLEIGSNHPIHINNTYILEKKYDWTGFMVEYDKSFLDSYKVHRPNSHWLMEDAVQIDYLEEFQKVDFPYEIDYLQIDLEVNNESTINTLKRLNETVMNEYKFAVVTFEHDFYSGDFFNTRSESRGIFGMRGYVPVIQDVKYNGIKPYEDWYVHPSLVDMNYIESIKADLINEHSARIAHG
jgi:hypothetical protein